MERLLAQTSKNLTAFRQNEDKITFLGCFYLLRWIWSKNSKNNYKNAWQSFEYM